jgi:hypothetical protein
LFWPDAAVFQESDGFVAAERIVDVVEVDEADDLFRGHFGQELPEGLGFGSGVEIPDSVDQGGGGEMDHSFFRTEPTKLGVAGELMAEGGEVVGYGTECAVDGIAGQVADGVADELVAVAAGEGEAEAAEVMVGFENAVGRGVVGIFIDRVGAYVFARSWKAQIDDADAGDAKISH